LRVEVGYREVALLLLAEVAGVLILASPDVPGAGLVVIGFLVTCPGWAIVRHLRLYDPIAELTLAVAVSLALNVLVGQFLVYMGAWSGRIGAAVLVAVTVTGTLFPVIPATADAAPDSEAGREAHPGPTPDEALADGGRARSLAS
jgi:hypothetical protein